MKFNVGTHDGGLLLTISPEYAHEENTVYLLRNNTDPQYLHIDWNSVGVWFKPRKNNLQSTIGEQMSEIRRLKRELRAAKKEAAQK